MSVFIYILHILVYNLEILQSILIHVKLLYMYSTYCKVQGTIVIGFGSVYMKCIMIIWLSADAKLRLNYNYLPTSKACFIQV